MQTRFLHSADWQLGKPFASLDDGAKRHRLQQERIQAVQRMAALVRETEAAFVLVVGDLFDSPHVTKATVSPPAPPSTAPSCNRWPTTSPATIAASSAPEPPRASSSAIKASKASNSSAPTTPTFYFATLSGGAKEQVAAAVRLALAEILAADHDGCLPILFDDAFAYSATLTASSPCNACSTWQPCGASKSSCSPARRMITRASEHRKTN